VLNELDMVGEKPKENIEIVDSGEGWPTTFEYQKIANNA